MENTNGHFSNYIYTFKTMLAEVEAIAVRHTRKYFTTTRQQPDISQDDFEFIKVREMYKIIIVPDKSLRHYFGCLSAEESKKAFRGYALHIHPDKNSHPSAKIAFQKLFKAFIVEPPRAGGSNK